MTSDQKATDLYAAAWRERRQTIGESGVESLGFTVQVRHLADAVEIAADDGRDRHAVTGPDEYLAACRLAEAIGIDIEDG